MFAALRRHKLAPMGDIGCYTLGALPPLLALDSCLCMGASIGMMAGFNKALGRKAAVAVIGDSTFFHSGVTPLIDAFYNEADGLVLVLDNRTTAMTGHQGHPGTGLRPDRSQGPAVDIQQLCEGIGVRCTTVDASDYGALDAAIKAELGRARAGRHRRPRALRPDGAREGRRDRRRRRALQPLRPVPRHRLPGAGPRRRDAVSVTDACTGCGLCVEVCRRGALSYAGASAPAEGAAMNGATTVSLVGVGGQGILLAAAILAETAAAEGLDVKASEVKGMAQRGGSVLSTVRFGEHVWSPVSRHADVVIATELLEGHRGLALLAPRGTLVCAVTTRIVPGSVLRREDEYPDDLPAAAAARGVRLIAVDAEALAREAGTLRAVNVVLLGAASTVAALQRGVLAARPRRRRAGQDPGGQRAGLRPRARRRQQRGGRAVKVTQLTVFLENRSGRLAEVADLLGAAGINIRGFSTTEAAEYGIVRLIVTDPERRPDACCTTPASRRTSRR